MTYATLRTDDANRARLSGGCRNRRRCGVVKTTLHVEREMQGVGVRAAQTRLGGRVFRVLDAELKPGAR